MIASKKKVKIMSFPFIFNIIFMSQMFLLDNSASVEHMNIFVSK